MLRLGLATPKAGFSPLAGDAFFYQS